MKAKVTGGSLRLRDKGSISAAVLLILPDGMEVEVKTQGDEWTRVKAEETEGYVMTKYLQMLPEEKAAAKPKKKTTKKAK